MQGIIVFFLSHRYIVVALLVLALIILLRFFMKRWKSRRETEEMSQYKRRDEALAEALTNPQVKDRCTGPSKPMEIMWDDKVVTKKGKRSLAPMVELVEMSEYSRRKYIYRLEQPIQIGSSRDNQLELLRDGVADKHCEIFLRGNKPCVRSLTSEKTILKRGTMSAFISADGVYLNNGDRIQMGSTEIRFSMFKG